MAGARVDLSVLRPFSPEEISGYLAFLRKNGETSVAAAVEAALRPIDVTADARDRVKTEKIFS